MRIKILLLALLLLSGVALAQSTKDVVVGVVGGTITAWDSKSLTIRGVNDEWTISLDSQKTKMEGHPSVDSPALVWFMRGNDGNLWASKVFVPQTTLWPAGNALLPASGEITGQLAKYDTNTVVIRSAGHEWTFAMDGTKTKVVGKPQIDNNATVQYMKADNGTMYAKMVQADK
jgi:hypothetical protein